MPELKLKRWEVFCQCFVVSRSASDAYSKAYETTSPEVNRNAGNRLLRRSEIRERIQELTPPGQSECLSAADIALVSEEIRTRDGRVKLLDQRRSGLIERRAQLLEVIQSRADDPGLSAIPGGQTGHVVVNRFGEHHVDAGLLREIERTERLLTEIERQVAQELGQWSERITIVPATTEEWWANLTPEQRDAEKARLQTEAARETVQ